MKKIILIIIFLISMSGKSGFAIDWTNQLNFYIQTERTKLNDTSWDGYNSSMAVKSFFVNFTTSPPDIMICIVDINGKNKCYHRINKKNKPVSYCHNSFDCEFYDIQTPNEIFGIALIDIDEKIHDLIDGVILTKIKKSRRSNDVKTMNDKLHELIDKVAPAITPGEKQRRMRPFQIFSISNCNDGIPCNLRQSQFEIISED